MTVEELITELLKVEDKTKIVVMEGEVWGPCNTEDPYDEGYYDDKCYLLYKVIEEKNYVSLRW